MEDHEEIERLTFEATKPKAKPIKKIDFWKMMGLEAI